MHSKDIGVNTLSILKQIIENVFKHTKQYESNTALKEKTQVSSPKKKDGGEIIKDQLISDISKNAKLYEIKDSSKTSTKNAPFGIDPKDRIKKEENLLLERQISSPIQEESKKNALETLVDREEVRWKAIDEQENVIKKQLDRANATYKNVLELVPQEQHNDAYNSGHDHGHEHHHYHSNDQKSVYQ
jgi:hypothetical protein